MHYRKQNSITIYNLYFIGRLKLQTQIEIFSDRNS